MNDRDPSPERMVMIRGCVVAAILAFLVGTQFQGVGQALGLSRGPAQSWKR